MNELDERAVATFGDYLGSLATDAQLLLAEIADESQNEAVRRILAGALNYLFKSLDLIDDGIEGLGYLDDAFVLRVACYQAAQGGTLPDSLGALRNEAELVLDFLGELAGRFQVFVAQLETISVRGRTAEAIVTDGSVRQELSDDIASWASRYKKPHFLLDERGLITLRAFLGAKLPK